MAWQLSTAALLCGAMLVGSPRPAAADYKDSFQRGFEALGRKRYAEAAGYLRQALRERPGEGGEPIQISGSFFSPYLPHYYLGVALFHSGDCAGAIKEWHESERQGAVAGTSEEANLRALETQCRGPLADKARLGAEGELDNARRVDRTLRGLVDGPEGREALGGTGDFLQRTKQAEDALAALARKIEAAKAAADLDGLAAARDQAAQAAQQLSGLTDEAMSLIGAWRGSPAAAKRVPGGPPPPLPPAQPPSARAGGQPPPPAEASAAEAPAAEATTAEAPAPEHAALRSAARAFFAGDYPATLLVLDHASFTSRRAGAQAALFAAAARMATYWLAGGRDPALLARAREDVRRCKRLNRTLRPSIRPQATAFSPRFIAFFDQPAARPPPG